MEYRQLGRTGVQVSSVCLGCMMFGRATSPEDAYPIVDRALDAGINFLDTANVYSRGKSEEITGEALHRNGKRHRVVLATKVHGRMADDDPNASGNSRRHIIAELPGATGRSRLRRGRYAGRHRSIEGLHDGPTGPGVRVRVPG